MTSSVKRDWADAVVDTAQRLLEEWRIESLPMYLHRNNSEYYYLSVWPGLSALDLAVDIKLPRRPARTEFSYIHIPFCSGLCSFCSYFLAVTQDADSDPRVARYMDDLVAQARIHQETTELDLSYLYLGGGTPSLLHPGYMERLLAGFSRLGILSSQLIGTIELHPEAFADVPRLGALLDVVGKYGIKRASLGFQTGSARILRTTNRRHGPDFLEEAISRLRAQNLTVNVDLMYGLPEQSMESWINSLGLVLAANPDSISTYFTFIDFGTPLWRDAQRDPAILLSHSQIQLQHLAAQTALEQAGYVELPNDFYSKPAGDPTGFAQETLPSDANMIAFGAGAYGYYPSVQYFNHLNLRNYSEVVRKGRDPVWRATVLTTEEELCRDIMFSLKNAPALNSRLFVAKYGVSPLDSHADTFARLADLGLVLADGDQIRLTSKGRLIVEEIACMFAPRYRRGSPAKTRRESILLRKHNFVPTYPGIGPV